MTCVRCEALRHEISSLKEEIAEWEAWARDERGADVDEQRLANWRAACGMASAAPVLALMAFADRPGRLISPRTVVDATRFGAVKATDDVQQRSLATTRICHLRRLLKSLAAAGRLPPAFGGRAAGIDMVWGQGWTMSPENAAAVRALAGEA